MVTGQVEQIWGVRAIGTGRPVSLLLETFFGILLNLMMDISAIVCASPVMILTMKHFVILCVQTNGTLFVKNKFKSN